MLAAIIGALINMPFYKSYKKILDEQLLLHSGQAKEY